MTAQEKAKELVDKFTQYTPAEEEFEHPYAVQCALIVVDEISKVTTPECNRYEQYYLSLPNEMTQCYWNEVKQEIEKL